jgi:hypothetical protein
MSGADLTHATHWVFDLDNTLYPSSAPVMSQVDRRMTQFVAQLLALPEDEAYQVQKHYWRTYGTTLNGLMANHEIDRSAFLDFVHDIDASVIDPASPPCPARASSTRTARAAMPRIFSAVSASPICSTIFSMSRPPASRPNPIARVSTVSPPASTSPPHNPSSSRTR